MKAILYIGAVLMTGASVYGFVDYKKSGQKVSKLYHTVQQDDKNLKTDITITEKKESAEKPLLPAESAKPVKAKRPAAPVKSVAAQTTEIKIEKPDHTPVIIEEPEKPLKPVTIKENTNGEKIEAAQKKKKLNYKMYSRAALDERFLEKETKVKSKKTDPAESKKQ